MSRMLMILSAVLLTPTVAMAWQTGDSYIDAVTAVVGSPKPADEVMRIVDEGHVDVNQYYSDGMTLMHYAAVAGRADVIEGFLARGGRLDVPRQQSDRATPLQLAKAPALVAYLRRVGAVPVDSPVIPPRPVAPDSTSSNPEPDSPRRKMCNARHYTASSLCSDTTCKMREYRKWQTCLKTGSYI